MKRLITLSVILLAAVTGTVHAAPLRTLSAYDVIASVNDLRANQGLAAYPVDSGLMAYAQQHSEYMVSTDTTSHVHSDGTTP